MATLTPINAASPLNASDNTRHAFTQRATETTSFALDNVDADFETMLTASWTIEYRQQGRSDDTLSLGLRVMSGATVLAAANSGGTFVTVNSNVTNTTDVTAGPTAFGYVNTTATKTDWDAAVVEISQTYSQNMGPDNAAIEVDHFQLTGTYDLAATPVTPDDALHSHAADSPTVIQTHLVTPASGAHAHAADSPVVGQTHVIGPSETSHAHAADSPTVDITHHISPSDGGHGHTADSPVVTQVHELVVPETLHTHNADSPLVTQQHMVSPNETSHGHTADSPVVAITHIINPSDGTHGHTADSPVINQTYKVLRVSSTGQARSSNFAEETTAGKLMILDKDSGVTVHGEIVETAGPFKLDGTNQQVQAVEFIEV